METPNPYQSSQVVSDVPTVDPNATDVGLEAIARRTFWEWEKLRLWFNGVLTAWTLLVAALFTEPLFRDPRLWTLATAGGVVANICFFAGPIVETYFTWLGWRAFGTRGLRWVIFALGTLATAMVAALAVGTLHFSIDIGDD